MKQRGRHFLLRAALGAPTEGSSGKISCLAVYWKTSTNVRTLVWSIVAVLKETGGSAVPLFLFL